MTRHAATLLHHPRWRPAWAVLLLLSAMVSAWFAFSPVPPAVPRGFSDKVQHVAAFAAMALTWALARAPAWRHAARALLVLGAYGVLIELVQSQLPQRRADAADVLADVLGIVAGLALAMALRRLLPPR
jgi:VanZ family protein